MSADARQSDDWHWLWETYVVGLCAAACVGVVMLNHRFPGNVPVAVAALIGMALCVLVYGRGIIRAAGTSASTFERIGSEIRDMLPKFRRAGVSLE